MIMLPRSVWEAMKAYCQSLLPEEACGLLAGFPENSGTGASRLTVTEFVPVPNISSHRLHEFEMSAQALTEHLFHIQKKQQKKSLIGFVHSHPTTPAVPSSKDANTLWKQTAAIILSFEEPDNPVIHAYTWTKKKNSRRTAVQAFSNSHSVNHSNVDAQLLIQIAQRADLSVPHFLQHFSP